MNKHMTTEKAVEMIDEYLLEPNNIDKAWVEALELCKQALQERDGQQAEIERYKGVIKLLERDVADAQAELKAFKKLYVNEIGNMAIKAFQRTSKERLAELYEKYHAIANSPQKKTDLFYQGRAEAIWECIKVNDTLVKEMMEDVKNVKNMA